MGGKVEIEENMYDIYFYKNVQIYKCTHVCEHTCKNTHSPSG